MSKANNGKGRQLRKKELFVLCGTPIHLGLHPYKVLSKYTQGFWSYMQINSIRPKTGKGDN